MSPARLALAAAAGLWALNLVYLAVVGWDSGWWDYHFTTAEKQLSQFQLPGKLPAAEKEYLRALDYAQLMVPMDGRLARTYHDLGLTYWVEHKYQEAQRSYEKAIPVVERIDGPDSWLMGVLTFRLGELTMRLGNRPQALTWLDRSSQILSHATTSSDPLSIRCRADRAMTLAYMARFQEARPLLERLLPQVTGNVNVGDLVFQNEVRTALNLCRTATSSP